MFTIKKPNLKFLTHSGNTNSLRAYLKRTVEGNPSDYRTPFWNGMPRDAIIKRWDRVFDVRIYKHTESDIVDSLIEYEHEQRAKVGPLSYQASLEDRMEGILEYWTKVENVRTISNFEFSSVFKEFQPIKGIRMKNVSHTLLDMKTNTNSGLPYFTRRNKVLSETKKLINNEDANKYPAILGWRGQEGGPNVEDVKQRTVFMMPFHLNVLELQIYQPLISALQKHKLVPAYVSLDEVEKTMTNLFDTKSKDDLVIATDFTKMDHHFNHNMQFIAKRILSYILHDDVQNKRWLEDIFPIKFNIPLLCSEDTIIEGNHGMGSGSGGTNADETLAHRYLQHEAARERGVKLNMYSQCLGDDGVITYPGITVEDLVNVYTKYGLDMNPEKQYAFPDHTIYLRRWYHYKYRVDGQMKGVYPTYRALGRLMSQERYYSPDKWSKEMVIYRAYAILENTNNHPLFETFVDFVIEGDKYKLGLEIPGFFDKLHEKYQRAKRELPSFNSYTQDNLMNQVGITEWKVVKYIMSKRKA